MGLLPGKQAITRIDWDLVRRAVAEVGRAGIGRNALVQLGTPGRKGPGRLGRILDELYGEMEVSPVPRREWKALSDTLGIDLLGRLVGISASSLHRYASGGRVTPDAVAGRLHFLALVVGDLSGAYNEVGIRRWFERRRAALGNRSPLELLRGEWDPEGKDALRVRELARALVASQAT